jgi:Asp-tRNA(Asn)/Glu-tRNA(Gln) amidotransferase B subunit
MNQHHVSTAGEYEGNPTNESFIKRANAVLAENKELKETLTDLMEQLKKVSVTNHNLAQIIKLVSENTTSKDEKKEIIERFKNEGKTIEASKALYESISRELQKANKMNITEEKSLTVESSKKINETPIYKSQDMLDSLDLMHRMMR